MELNRRNTITLIAGTSIVFLAFLGIVYVESIPSQEEVQDEKSMYCLDINSIIHRVTRLHRGAISIDFQDSTTICPGGVERSKTFGNSIQDVAMNGDLLTKAAGSWILVLHQEGKPNQNFAIIHSNDSYNCK